jgi:4-hydroxy-2-oxoheptanedioate aldolase
MRENTLQTIWASGGAAVNCWATIPSSFAAEMLANQGYDSVTVDMQHGMIDYNDTLLMLQAISTTPAIPLVRVPWNEPAIVMKVLDAGALGVICPMTNTRAEVEAFVGACRFPPLGYRSYGPLRANIYAGGDYYANANNAVVALAMIETVQAADNLEDILSVPGLSGTYFGPSDMGISLGIGPGMPLDTPGLAEMIDKVVRATRQRGLIAGIQVNSAADAIAMINKGFQLVTPGHDARSLMTANREVVNVMRNSGAKIPAL